MIIRNCPHSVSFSRICNPTASNISICNALFRIENPYIQCGWIANPAERAVQIVPHLEFWLRRVALLPYNKFLNF